MRNAVAGRASQERVVHRRDAAALAVYIEPISSIVVVYFYYSFVYIGLKIKNCLMCF